MFFQQQEDKILNFSPLSLFLFHHHGVVVVDDGEISEREEKRKKLLISYRSFHELFKRKMNS